MTRSPDDALAHRDEHGVACARHAAAKLEPLLHLAAIGSRMSSYNHDIASKIQGLMMAVDELGELVGAMATPDPDLLAASETARLTLDDLNALLQSNRALTKPAPRTRLALADLVRNACQRVAITIRGSLPVGEVEVGVPLATQGLTLAFDAAAGPGRNRTLEFAVAGPAALTVTMVGDHALAANAGEWLALASWCAARDGGRVWCTRDSRLAIRYEPAA